VSAGDRVRGLACPLERAADDCVDVLGREPCRQAFGLVPSAHGELGIDGKATTFTRRDPHRLGVADE
jgi:hypothetical protein